MTTLGTLVKGLGLSIAPLPFDPARVMLELGHAIARHNMTASMAGPGHSPSPAAGLGNPASVLASVIAWTQQDDDAHEPCSLTACRHPLHPGPCKGWKGTLHAVSPGTYRQLEEARVEKANTRRLKRIADLRSQGKPIPRKLLEEIKPKPAPVHPANNAQAVPLGQVNQKADLAGGQAHTAGQAVSKAAGVQVKTAPPLPLGPKQKKPTIAGRGPAFVITQPKVTDTYKLDKADKITPQEWSSLTDADKTTIRNELTAIKARGFGPQQTKADALLAKLPAPGAANGLAPGTPGTITTPSGKVYQKVSVAPGKVSLGQASKTVPAAPSATPTPQLPAPPPAPRRGTRDQNGILNKPLPGGSVSSTSVGLPQGYRITRDGMGYSLKHNGRLIRTSSTQAALEKYAAEHHASAVLGLPAPATPPPAAPSATKPDITDQVKKALDPSAKLGPPARLFVHRQMTKGQFDSLDDATQKKVLDDLDHQIANGSGARTKQLAQDVKDRFQPAAAPSGPAALKPSAPLAPGTAAHVQHANAVANRTAPKAQMSKTQVDSYGTLSKADFDQLAPAAQKTIRDDLANAKGKFLDPKKRQAAQDLLDRFGSRHPASAAPGPSATPASPAHPKGYSDPMSEVIKAAQGGDNGKFLQTVARISPATAANFDNGDRKQILAHLDFIASHPKATDEQKAKASAYGRIFGGGTHVPAATKFDHTPSIGELHTEEQKGGHAAAFDALKAADDTSMPRADRMKALTALDKAQFDALAPDEQRKITDALHVLHTDQKGTTGGITLDKAAGLAIERLTGVRPGLHRLRQAEADFRAGKIDAKQFWAQLLRARVQDPGSSHTPGSAGALLEKEAARVARDNPTLPLWLRASMIENPYNAIGRTYNAVAMASMEHTWEPAPRLSGSDITAIFGPTVDDLAAADPIHAEAIKALRGHLIETGLKGDPGVPTGSPWSLATRNHVVDNLLGISSVSPEVPAERLAEYNALPHGQQALVRKVLRERLDSQTSDHAKTGTWLALRELEGRAPLSPEQRDAAMAATDSFPRSGADDTYRKLLIAEFDELPTYTRAAIRANLLQFQTRAERSGPVRTWGASDNPLEVFPGALADHLAGVRTFYADRRLRNASDIANFGTKIINPFDRTRAYEEVPIGLFRNMPLGDQALINDDLDKIAADTANPLQIRYGAQVARDVLLNTPAHINTPQLVALKKADPRPGRESSDADVIGALGYLDKSDYDKLNKTYREAIDARIAALPGAVQQAMTAKYHPAAPAATPAGYTPTTVQANVPPHVQAALDTIYGVHKSGKSHTMAHQLSTYGALRGSDFSQLNAQEQGHLLGDLSFIATTAKGPSADKARKLIDRFTPAGTPSGQVPTGAVIPPANAVPGQVRYATPLKGLEQAKDSGKSGDGWISLPGGGRVWGAHGAAGLLLQHVDPQTGEKRYLMVQRGPAISDPGKWTFPGGASDSKETPHQGAARETIEELGLKADALKDALVHGDHTFSVPNHSWKYTTVAAQVPTMIKPNLTTAHARAETSDAKWMTIDEIRALDKSGQLHGPIAGGKLEQNVISLYPQGTGQTLGQVARPGPVTKRPGRLRLPSAGRQAPATFNAWPHAHKPSKGKDLIPDKAAFDAQRQKIKQDRKLYDGKTADGRLAAIGAQQGFDDTPTVVDRKEIDRLLATGDYIEAWRGVSGAGGWSARSRGGSGGKTAADINEEMRTGPAYYGKGIFGNGYYLATQKRVAEQYSDHTHGSVVRILIPKSAVTQKYDKVSKESHANPRMSKAKGGGYDVSTFYDPGRYAAAKGLDGIEINAHHRSPSGGAAHVASSGKPAFNWLNRSVLILQKEPA